VPDLACHSEEEAFYLTPMKEVVELAGGAASSCRGLGGLKRFCSR